MKGRMKMDYAKLRESAADTLHDLEKIDPGKMSKEQFLLCGAATAILDHFEQGEKAAGKKAAYIMDDTTYADYVAEELRDADKYWNDYLRTKKEKFKYIAKQELAHAAALLEEIEDKSVEAELSTRLRSMEKVIK